MAIWVLIGGVTAFLALWYDWYNGRSLRVGSIFGTFFWCIICGPFSTLSLIIGVIDAYSKDIVIRGRRKKKG